MRLGPDYENEWVDDLPAEEYHSLRQYVNSSSLRHILKSPHYFRWKFMQPQKTTDAMQFGKIAHQAIYEPKEFKELAVAYEKVDRRTKAGREKFQALNDDLGPGQYLIELNELRRIEMMKASIAKHPVAKAILEAGYKERSGFYRCPMTGLACRFRPDQWFEERGFLIDFKTTKDVSKRSFSKSIDQYDYDLQASFYCLGGKEITGLDVVRRVWVVAESLPPYEIAVYVGDEKAMDSGWELHKHAMYLLDECLKKDKWPMAQMSAEDISVPWYRYERIMNALEEDGEENNG